MQLTEKESKTFWPLYHEYRAEMDKVADGLISLVKDYDKSYPDVPEASAERMLKDLIDLEKKQLATREKYLKKFSKVLPAPKTLRFAQVENRLDLALRLELAAGIPLVPIEGRMTPKGMDCRLCGRCARRGSCSNHPAERKGRRNRPGHTQGDAGQC